MSHKLSDGLQKQISKVTLLKNKPLLITDADEVLLNFVKCFEIYLEKKGFWYDLTSYALFGNIKQKGTDEVVSNEVILEYLDDFFRTESKDITFVEGSIHFINKLLDSNFQILVLTNIPFKYLDDRKHCFQKNGLNLQIIAGNGPKGLVIKELIRDFKEKVFFIDDLAPHISSVKEEVSRSKTIHYISDERLSKLAVSPKEADFRAYSWKDIYNFLINEISG